MLTPQEVTDRGFTKVSFGGYNLVQVDEFLDTVTKDYTTLFTENSTLKRKMKVLQEKIDEYRETEEKMRKAFSQAQQMCDQMVADAKNKSEQILEDARSMVDDNRKVAEEERVAEEQKLVALKQMTAKYVESVRELHSHEVEYLDSLAVVVNSETLPFVDHGSQQRDDSPYKGQENMGYSRGDEASYGRDDMAFTRMEETAPFPRVEEGAYLPRPEEGGYMQRPEEGGFGSRPDGGGYGRPEDGNYGRGMEQGDMSRNHDGNHSEGMSQNEQPRLRVEDPMAQHGNMMSGNPQGGSMGQGMNPMVSAGMGSGHGMQGNQGMNSGNQGMNSGNQGMNSGNQGMNSGNQGMNSGNQGMNSGNQGMNSGNQGMNSGNQGMNSGNQGMNSGNQGMNTSGQSGQSMGDSSQQSLNPPMSDDVQKYLQKAMNNALGEEKAAEWNEQHYSKEQVPSSGGVDDLSAMEATTRFFVGKDMTSINKTQQQIKEEMEYDAEIARSRSSSNNIDFNQFTNNYTNKNPNGNPNHGNQR